MTKFEEEAIKEAKKSKVIANSYAGEFTASDIGLNIKLGRATHNFPWLEFAKNWHSDEEFQKMVEIGREFALANENLIDVNTKLAEEIANLKSQLQQQALPVVPECVAKIVELLKKNPESSWSKLYSSLGEEGVTWLNDFQHKDERFGFGGLNSKLFVLFHLAINGYTVEKPQLFYLKNKITGMYLNIRLDDGTYEESDSKYHHMYRTEFTKQEIDSMQTGSYEQIEVEVEK